MRVRFLRDVGLGYLAPGRAADLILVAPATARLIGAYRAGLSTDLLTNVLLATRAPVMISAPSSPSRRTTGCESVGSIAGST